ncbi:MAG TPA: PadR family transcriptional regulator [Firmicutes bacterium]|nr:PadR family transcriptional regulator [Bacillota bacterium]
MRIDKELTAASVVPLLLLLLEQEESYGYRIIKRIRECSQGHWQWSEGMLYPVLHRLEQRKWIESFWHMAESGRRRKYYRLTALGRKELHRQLEQWRMIYGTLSQLGFEHQSQEKQDEREE